MNPANAPLANLYLPEQQIPAGAGTYVSRRVLRSDTHLLVHGYVAQGNAKLDPGQALELYIGYGTGCDLWFTGKLLQISGQNLILYAIETESSTDYRQAQIDVYHLWRMGLEPDWREMLAADKYGWIRACYVRTGGLEAIRLRAQGEYVVQGKDIRCADDLYCSLAEALTGYGGYLGACLETLADCLQQIQPQIHGQTIRFEHHETIIRRLQRHAPGLWDKMIALLHKMGFRADLC